MTIAGPVPAQIISKSETRWQTLLVLFALKTRCSLQLDWDLEEMLMEVGVVGGYEGWRELQQWTGWAWRGPEQCCQCPFSSSSSQGRLTLSHHIGFLFPYSVDPFWSSLKISNVVLFNIRLTHLWD